MTKQIGVISDIHSNYTAFKTAAEYMINRGITELFLLGDYVSDTVETLQYLHELMAKYKVTAIRGNREDYFTEAAKIVGIPDYRIKVWRTENDNTSYTTCL